MGYLKFDKTLLINLEESLQREILRTNRGRAYHSTTIVDCNTRKYHGLLVCPVPGLDNDNHVLLSSMNETVIQHGAEFNLGVHQYPGYKFSPKGHRYVRQFEFDNLPKTIYRVGGVIMSKEKMFTAFENRILIKYTLLDAHSPTTLRFQPFLAFRNVNELTHVNSNANLNYEEITNGIKTCMYKGYPDLHLQFSKPAKFVFKPDWYRDIEYSKEQERGFPFKEDLYVPGYFELPIEKGESVYFSGSDTLLADTDTLSTLFTEESKTRTPRTSFFNCLKNSAQQFYFRPTENDAYLLAGYPWFKVRARDLFISMPGCSLAIDDPVRFEKIMDTAVPALRNFMQENRLDNVIQEINLPDVLLWAIWAMQQYAKAVTLESCNTRYGDLIQEIIQYIKNNKHPNLKLDSNGLVYAKGRNTPITWMNSTENGKPIIPRSGYIVEFNALWYNALKFAAELLQSSVGTGSARLSKKIAEEIDILERLAEQTAESFVKTFINEHRYLFDYVDHGHTDWSVRPNMLLAAALDYSPLSRIQKRDILTIVTKELLTPKGIRSLSPKSEGYRPYYNGNQHERDLAYHQGTVYPWLLGFYLEAYLRLYQYSGVAFVERMLIGMEEEMNTHCISTLPELFDGNPPFQSHGATSFAMSVAAILRVLKLLEKFEV